MEVKVQRNKLSLMLRMGQFLYNKYLAQEQLAQLVLREKFYYNICCRWRLIRLQQSQKTEDPTMDFFNGHLVDRIL